MFYYFWGKENRPLYQGLRYIEVRYVEVPQYVLISYHCGNYSVVIGLVLFSETTFKTVLFESDRVLHFNQGFV